MLATLISRRKIATTLVALPAGLCISTRALDAPSNAENSQTIDGDGLTHTSEAIHQEITFAAEPRRIFEALTNSKHFDAITRLSDALALVTAPDARPTSISRAVGGSFTLFGGYITGRNLEMERDARLVQAWCARSWDVGDYSIARFVLVKNGTETKLVFDHRGFPQGAGAHLASGWHTHYWEPLAKFLAQG